MLFQLSWETAPGLGGLRCEGFRAVAVEQPEGAAGVAIECGSQQKADRLAQAAEEQFARKRFSNAAAAFEAVKTFVWDQAVGGPA